MNGSGEGENGERGVDRERVETWDDINEVELRAKRHIEDIRVLENTERHRKSAIPVMMDI